MIKIEAITLEQAYQDAATKFECSITELAIEVVQAPTSGFLGFFKKSAIIVAVKKESQAVEPEVTTPVKEKPVKERPKQAQVKKTEVKKVEKEEKVSKKKETHTILNDTIMPASFVSDQDDEDEDLASGLDYTADYDDAFDEQNETHEDIEETSIDINTIASEIQEEINTLFKFTCFSIEKIEVTAYDAETILVEFKGDDAALLIGKEGYRYKALSYMIFNWINSKYEVQLRLEIAEFLKNQEETISRYLTAVCENIERDGRAQTKILDGVLVQIALRELRERYPNKYVAIRSTRDGLKFIIVNEYNNY